MQLPEPTERKQILYADKVLMNKGVKFQYSVIICHMILGIKHFQEDIRCRL